MAAPPPPAWYEGGGGGIGGDAFLLLLLLLLLLLGMEEEKDGGGGGWYAGGGVAAVYVGGGRSEGVSPAPWEFTGGLRPKSRPTSATKEATVLSYGFQALKYQCVTAPRESTTLWFLTMTMSGVGRTQTSGASMG